MISQAARGFSILMIVKILSRIIDFLLNILVIRKMDPQIYGLTTHLGLLSNFSLFYLKVCLKQAYQRRVSTTDQKPENQEITQTSARNMMIYGLVATIFITPIITIAICLVYGELNEQFTFSCILHAVAAIIEGAAEPLAVQFVLTFNYTVPAQAETVAVSVKTVVLYIMCTYMDVHPLVAFGYSQIIFSVLYFMILYYHSSKKHSLRQLIFLKEISRGVYIQSEMKIMGSQFTLMALMKFLLQELEKIIIVTFRRDDIKVSAEYSLVSHIGALVPRFIYSPIEEVSYNLFSKLSSEQQTRLEKSEQDSDLLIEKSPQKNKKVLIEDNLILQGEYLFKIIKIMNAIGAGFIFAGIPLSKGFLIFVYGQQWGSVSCYQALELYCVYEFLMGINGITESFVTGNLKQNEMSFYRRCLLFITIIYIFASVSLVSFGAFGIILASCISMVARITISMFLITKKLYHGSKLQTLLQFRQAMPSPLVFILYIVGVIIFQKVYQDGDLQTYSFLLIYFGSVFALSIFQIRRDITDLYKK